MQKRTVSFDNHNVLDAKRNNLTALMSKLTTKNKNKAKLFMAKIYKGKRRDQGRSNYYGRGQKQLRNRSNSRQI